MHEPTPWLKNLASAGKSGSKWFLKEHLSTEKEIDLFLSHTLSEIKKEALHLVSEYNQHKNHSRVLSLLKYENEKENSGLILLLGRSQIKLARSKDALIIRLVTQANFKSIDQEIATIQTTVDPFGGCELTIRGVPTNPTSILKKMLITLHGLAVEE